MEEPSPYVHKTLQGQRTEEPQTLPLKAGGTTVIQVGSTNKGWRVAPDASPWRSEVPYLAQTPGSKSLSPPVPSCNQAASVLCLSCALQCFLTWGGYKFQQR